MEKMVFGPGLRPCLHCKIQRVGDLAAPKKRQKVDSCSGSLPDQLKESS